MDTTALMERALELHGAGEDSAAEQLCKEVLAEESDNPDAHFLIGVIEHRRGNSVRAQELLERAIQIESSAFWYFSALAEVQATRGNIAGAIESLRIAVKLNPDQPVLLNGLAQFLVQLGRDDQAAEIFSRMTELEPGNAKAFRGLGDAQLAIGRAGEAEQAYRRAIALDPQLVDSHVGLVLSLTDAGKSQEAERMAHELARRAPNNPAIDYVLGVVLQNLTRYDEASDALERALAREPDHVNAHLRLAMLQSQAGEVKPAFAHWDAATELAPLHARSQHLRLMHLNYRDDLSVDNVIDAHDDWAEKFADPITAIAPAHLNNRDPNRRLRIAYFSSDLRDHVVALFFKPILENHDRDQFETICFSSVRRPDEMTGMLRELASRWHDVAGIGTEALADLVRREQIDIAIDLSGHTGLSRLDVFAHKPAPVQISYLGYCNTTGMRAMDYIVGDTITDPTGDTQAYVENIIRLEGGFSCYQPPRDAPAVNELPAIKNGFITLASFHVLQKLNAGVLDLWADVLQRVTNARLLIWRDTCSPRVQDRLRYELSARGIDAQRIIFRNDLPKMDRMLLGVYHEADIALDALPWSGHTSACNSTWMGVPFVTLRGNNHAGRMAASALSFGGFPQFVANSPQEFSEIVASLAGDLPRLTQLRRTMRETMSRSPLCDGKRFIQTWERNLRTAWTTWCSS